MMPKSQALPQKKQAKGKVIEVQHYDRSIQYSTITSASTVNYISFLNVSLCDLLSRSIIYLDKTTMPQNNFP